MMELLFILLIVVIGVCFLLRKPERPSFQVPPELYSKEYADKLKEIRPDIIEDSSHLKAELAAAKEHLVRSHENSEKLNQELGQLQFRLQQLATSVIQLSADKVAAKEAYDKVISQKKSGEVRLGHVAEQLFPMLPEFPVPIHTLKFFGNPIDYISIDMEAEIISFIEVKSGGSVLSDKQKKIRKMINEKKVQFFEVRIDEKGVKVK